MLSPGQEATPARPRRICRERKTLVGERTLHINHIKGLLFGQGITGCEPSRSDRRERLEELRTGDGHILLKHFKAPICRELDRLELLLEQIKAVEAERDALLAEEKADTTGRTAMLLAIKGISGSTLKLRAGPSMRRSRCDIRGQDRGP